MRMYSLGPLLVFLFLPAVTPAAVIFAEDFDAVSNLPAAGWVDINNSSPAGETSWFQGNPISSFTAQAGASNSYIAANFNNAAFGGDISNWLILPVLTLRNGDTLTFWTRTENGAVPGDSVQVRLSNGASSDVGTTSTSVGDFTTLLTTIDGAYPENWTQYSSTVSGLPGPTIARLAVRYSVTNTSVAGDIIGIDSLSVATAVPEPVTTLLLGLGVTILGLGRFR
jgi:hypothetical protein